MHSSPRVFLAPDALTVNHACDVSAQLVAAFQSVECVEIDLRQVIEVDVAGVQLLIAAARSAERNNKRLALLGLDGETIRGALVRLGLLGAEAQARTETERFWRGH